MTFADVAGQDEAKESLQEVVDFLENPGQILLKEQILERIWDKDGKFVDENTVSVNIRRLRRKIEADPQNPQWIQTVHGLGYIWREEEKR